MIQIFQLIVLLFSVIIHEISHGYAALKLGDDTAERMGRLTLNPLAHLDLWGSVLMPLFLFFATNGRFVFGYAKPVPYNPLKLKNPLKDSALLAFAGPLANLSLAIIFGLLIRVFNATNFFLILIPYFQLIVFTNLILAIFNLLPVPPLDGSKILFYFWPSPKVEMFLYQYSFLILILFIMFGWNLIYPIIYVLFTILTGIH
ncbi:MAG: site-2 protease family protein [Parcubacteria group bacterium]|nr:site-2 protease family protein [Parcubacteria group bacterium]